MKLPPVSTKFMIFVCVILAASAVLVVIDTRLVHNAANPCQSPPWNSLDEGIQYDPVTKQYRNPITNTYYYADSGRWDNPLFIDTCTNQVTHSPPPGYRSLKPVGSECTLPDDQLKEHPLPGGGWGVNLYGHVRLVKNSDGKTVVECVPDSK